jgi:glycosyltransferase involved in cell wall biosynthesis
MPRLLLICEFPTLCGGERSMLATLGGLQSAGYEINVACPPTGLLAETVQRRGFVVTPFSVQGSDGRRIPLQQLRPSLRTVLASQRPHLVHANSLSMSRLAGPVTAELGLPSVGHLRDIVGMSRAAMADVNRMGRLLAVSHATRDFHVDAGLDPTKTHVLHNGVCLQEFQPRPATGWLHEELGLPRHVRLLTSVGQIGMRKGLDVLLRAAEDVVRKHDDAAFLIAGRRQSVKAEAIAFEEQIVRAVAAEPLVGRVFMLGQRDDVAAILNESTLLVHAARQEPFGRVLLEAAAAGVAVVATDVGGTREVFRAGQSVSDAPSRGGTLVPPDNAPALAEAIMRILETPGYAAQLGAAGRRWAEQALDVRDTIGRLLTHYRAVLETGQPGCS